MRWQFLLSDATEEIVFFGREEIATNCGSHNVGLAANCVTKKYNWHDNLNEIKMEFFLERLYNFDLDILITAPKKMWIWQEQQSALE